MGEQQDPNLLGLAGGIQVLAKILPGLLGVIQYGMDPLRSAHHGSTGTKHSANKRPAGIPRCLYHRR
ncbi:hypothetical protein GCM10027563_25990 [Parasphingorhabdus pacifica]